MDTETTPHAVETEPAQATDPEVAIQPGAETAPVKTEEVKPEPAKAEVKEKKTYSEEEYSQAMSKLQAEKAQVEEVLNRFAMEQQIKAAQEAERQELAKDRQDVEAGNITEDEARRRGGLRQQTSQLQQQAAQLQQYVRQQATQGEALGRVLMARDLAKEYDLNMDDLISDTSLKTPLDMVQKAAKLAIAKLKESVRKTETYVQGPTPALTEGEDDSKLSAIELARKAYAKRK